MWRARRRSAAPNSMYKIVWVAILKAAAYLVIALAAWHGGGRRSRWLWLGAYFVMITIGEVYL